MTAKVARARTRAHLQRARPGPQMAKPFVSGSTARTNAGTPIVALNMSVPFATSVIQNIPVQVEEIRHTQLETPPVRGQAQLD